MKPLDSAPVFPNPDFPLIIHPGSFGSPFMGKPALLVAEVADRLRLYQKLPLISAGMNDYELSWKFNVGIGPLSRKTLLLGMEKRLDELLRHHHTDAELLQQRAIVTTELKKIDDRLKAWQKEQRNLRKKYPQRSSSPETVSQNHQDIDEGSRAELDCCGL